MSQRVPVPCFHPQRAGALPIQMALALVAAVGLFPAAGQSQPKLAAQRVAIARSDSPAGTLLEREGPQKPWQVVAPGQDVFTRDLLLALPGLRANLEAKGALRLSLLGALPEPAGVPVLESVVTLKQDPAVDLELTLKRGRILLAHGKASGSIRVRVRFRNQTWDLALAEPGTQVALERVDGWPPGVPFEKNPRPEQRPMTDVYLLLLKGKVNLNDGSEQQSLDGQVVFHWSAARGAVGPLPLKKVPGWINPEANLTAQDRALKAAADRLRQRLSEGKVDSVLQKALAEGDTEGRVLAVYSAGACDDLPLLLTALRDAKHAEVRDAAVAALRHWIGSAAGQDLKLYETLVKADYRPGQAETILQLLHTFAAPDLGRPETYETLIDYLKHDKLAIRQLAHWHLARLVPQGRDINFNAAGSAEERARALEAWRRLVPAGQLPPAAKSK
jgi:hypothetical protein